MNDPTFRSELVRIQRNPWVLACSILPIVCALVLACLSSTAAPFAILLTPLAALGGMTAWRKNLRPRQRRVTVTADATGITLGDEHVPRATIRAGFVKPGAKAPRALIARVMRPPIELEVSHRDDARALLHALGLDASQRVADFRTPSLILSRQRYLAGAGVAMGLLAAAFGGSRALTQWTVEIGLAFAAFLAFTLAFAVLVCIPAKVRVGADGIEVRWLHVRRYMPYGDVLDVRRYESGWGNSKVTGLRVLRRSGQTVRIPVHRGGWFDDDQLALLEERIAESKEGYRGGDVAVDAALLERAGRPVRDWVASLRAIGAGANATLRLAPLPRERLLRILEDPTQPASARAAAAIAVGAEGDEEGRARLRLAAEATVAPKLRVSIEHAARGDDEPAIEAALAEIDAEREQKKRAS